ncbi:hypothetical protein [Sphingobium psychrophilum]|nr:hypothetical protein [Sphingobium psychrophilum]
MTRTLWASLPMGLALAAGLTAAQPVAAQPAMRLGTQTFVERVSTDINGRPRRTLASADRVGPGDTLIVIVHWRNASTQPVRDFAVTRAVPPRTRPDLNDPHMQVSVDGGGHWGRLDQFWLPTPLGGMRRAVVEDVTHIRWQLPEAVPPGRTGRISYRAVMR